MTPERAVERVMPGQTVMVGGFGQVGAPRALVNALLASPTARDLTIVSNNIGEPDIGLGKLLRAGLMRKAVGSYFTTNPDVIEAREAGELEVELLPQGTFSEAIRAGGAGIGGFYVRTGVGTLLAEGKETREIDGVTYLFQTPLRADVSLVKAARADKAGNLAYRRTARNFNPDMATAAELVIAEVDEIVEVGDLEPDLITTPHPYVDIVVRSAGAIG
jgi:3-oxoacid CoA-transferase A subunit